MNKNSKTITENIASGVQIALGLALLSNGVYAMYAVQKSRARKYAFAGLVGGVVGYLILNDIFVYSWDYPPSDEHGELKGRLRGAFIGASLAAGIIVLSDEKMNVIQKNIASAGIGSLVGYMASNAYMFGKPSDAKNAVSGIIGGMTGLAVYHGIRGAKETRIGRMVQREYDREDLAGLMTKGHQKTTT